MWNMSKINKKRHLSDVNWHEHTVSWRCCYLSFWICFASCSTFYYFYVATTILFLWIQSIQSKFHLKVKSDLAVSALVIFVNWNGYIKQIPLFKFIETNINATSSWLFTQTLSIVTATNDIVSVTTFQKPPLKNIKF